MTDGNAGCAVRLRHARAIAFLAIETPLALQSRGGSSGGGRSS